MVSKCKSRWWTISIQTAQKSSKSSLKQIVPLSNLKFLQVTRQSFILHLSSLNSSLTGILQDSKRIHLYFYYNPRHVSWASFTKNVQRSSRDSLRIAWNPNPSLAVDFKIHRSVPSAALFCFATPSRILWMGLKTLRDSSETVWNSEDSSSFFWDCLEICCRVQDPPLRPIRQARGFFEKVWRCSGILQKLSETRNQSFHW